MKLLVFVTVLVVARTVGATELKSADLKRCPNGHTTLKDVPIACGLPAASTPEQWKKIEQQVENLELVLGGCVVENGSPTVRPICATCRFAYDSHTRTWSRRSSDIRS